MTMVEYCKATGLGDKRGEEERIITVGPLTKWGGGWRTVGPWATRMRERG